MDGEEYVAATTDNRIAPDSVIELISCNCRTCQKKCSCRKKQNNCTDFCGCTNLCENTDPQLPTSVMEEEFMEKSETLLFASTFYVL